MDFAELLGDALDYTRTGTLNNTNRWMRMILAVICLGLPFNGYILRVYRGATPAPEVDGWGTLFVDGLKMLAVGLVYIIPVMISALFLFIFMLLAMLSGTADEPGAAAVILESLFMALLYILEIIVAIFLPVAYIRFARTGVFLEAFNFSALKATIGRIGWLNYIIAVVLVGLVISVPLCVMIFAFFFVFLAAVWITGSNLIVMIGLIALLVIVLLPVIPLIGVFHARYLTRVYEMAGE
jgi:hypothetical protein